MIEKIATKLLVKQLVDGGHLELDGDPEDALAALVEVTTDWLLEHARDADCAARLGYFFEKQRSVAETFADEELLAEKLAVWHSATRRFAKPVEHRDPALEQQILDNLEDDAARLVYADVLQQHGDPLGELVTRHASKNTRAASRLLKEHGAFLFGPVEEYLRLFKIEYHLGFIRSIEITRKAAFELEWDVVTGWLLDRPIARFLEHVSIGPLPGHCGENGVWNAVLAAPRIALRSIALTSKSARLVDPLELARIAATTPRLRDVRIEAGRIDGGPFEHAGLRRLTFALDQGNELDATLAESALPALEELAITTRWNTTARRMWPRDAPALRTLRLAIGADPGVLVETLVDDPLLAQLAELEITNVGADSTRVLVAHADRFAHLTKLSLPDHRIPARVLRELGRVIPIA
jgi:uncharacterized protein (TIGR02996 family)